MKAPKTSITDRTPANGIQRGDKTQSQDHAIYAVSFSPMNRTVKSPQKPMPPLLDVDVLIVMLVEVAYYVR